MTSLLWAVLILMLLTLGLLLWQFNRLTRRLQNLEQILSTLQGERSAFPAEFRKLLSTKQTELISIELLNPMELAAKQSKLASTLGSLTPSLVRRIVHNEAMKITRQHLEKHGAKARVRFHGAG